MKQKLTKDAKIHSRAFFVQLLSFEICVNTCSEQWGLELNVYLVIESEQ